jgi:hypothetical protein
MRCGHVVAVAGGVSDPGLSRSGGCVFGVLRPLESELAGELVAEGAVLGAQAGDLGPGGVEPLAERVGAGVLRGGWWLVVTELADEVPDLVLPVEPGRETPAACATAA